MASEKLNPTELIDAALGEGFGSIGNVGPRIGVPGSDGGGGGLGLDLGLSSDPVELRGLRTWAPKQGPVGPLEVPSWLDIPGPWSVMFH